MTERRERDKKKEKKRIQEERKEKDRREREESEDWLSREGCRGTGSCWKDQQWGAVHHHYALCILTIILLNIDIDRLSPL